MYARLKLEFSKTLSTLIFRSSQIKEVSDILADEITECTIFLKKRQKLRENFDFEVSKVMNDDCSRLSVDAARQIARHLDLVQTSKVFQVKIEC